MHVVNGDALSPLSDKTWLHRAEEQVLGETSIGLSPVVDVKHVFKHKQEERTHHGAHFVREPGGRPVSTSRLTLCRLHNKVRFEIARDVF